MFITALLFIFIYFLFFAGLFMRKAEEPKRDEV